MASAFEIAVFRSPEETQNVAGWPKSMGWSSVGWPYFDRWLHSKDYTDDLNFWRETKISYLHGHPADDHVIFHGIVDSWNTQITSRTHRITVTSDNSIFFHLNFSFFKSTCFREIEVSLLFVILSFWKEKKKKICICQRSEIKPFKMQVLHFATTQKIEILLVTNPLI